jgi:hypothetical protein
MRKGEAVSPALRFARSGKGNGRGHKPAATAIQ